LPSSQHYHISKIMDLVIGLKPNSVLDIGAGFGKYGILCREYLELWDGRQVYGEFTRRIDAIEAFEEYITPIHKFVYNHVYVDDVLEIIDRLDFSYDLVLLVDVLEHFDKDKGTLLVRKILAKNRGVIISTPKKVSNQIDAFGNEYEIHRSQWTQKELSLFDTSLFLKDDVSLICYIGKEEDVEKLKGNLARMKDTIKKKGDRSLAIRTKKLLRSVPLASRTYHLVKKGSVITNA
jgi:SAM-dependent methyltransferase